MINYTTKPIIFDKEKIFTCIYNWDIIDTHRFNGLDYSNDEDDCMVYHVFDVEWMCKTTNTTYLTGVDLTHEWVQIVDSGDHLTPTTITIVVENFEIDITSLYLADYDNYVRVDDESSEMDELIVNMEKKIKFSLFG